MKGMDHWTDKIQIRRVYYDIKYLQLFSACGVWVTMWPNDTTYLKFTAYSIILMFFFSIYVSLEKLSYVIYLNLLTEKL